MPSNNQIIDQCFDAIDAACQKRNIARAKNDTSSEEWIQLSLDLVSIFLRVRLYNTYHSLLQKAVRKAYGEDNFHASLALLPLRRLWLAYRIVPPPPSAQPPTVFHEEDDVTDKIPESPQQSKTKSPVPSPAPLHPTGRTSIAEAAGQTMRGATTAGTIDQATTSAALAVLSAVDVSDNDIDIVEPPRAPQLSTGKGKNTAKETDIESGMAKNKSKREATGLGAVGAADIKVGLLYLLSCAEANLMLSPMQRTTPGGPKLPPVLGGYADWAPVIPPATMSNTYGPSVSQPYV